MSAFSISSPRRVTSIPVILRRQKATASTIPATTLIQLDSATPTPETSATNSSDNSGSAAGSDNTCTTNSDCASDTSCLGGRCINPKEAGLLSSGSGATSQLNTGTAVGIVGGVIGFTLLLVAFGFWFIRRRRRRSMQLPPLATHDRSQSNATAFTVDNDQKTLVASLQNSPQQTKYGAQRSMPLEFHMETGAMNGNNGRVSATVEDTEEISPTTPNKSLPLPPLPPPPHGEDQRFTLNVSINKSMLFEEEAARMVRETTQPQEPGPRYRFKEIHPPAPAVNRQSIAQQTISSMHSSMYEVDRYSALNGAPSVNSWIYDNYGSQEQPRFLDQRDSTLSRLEGIEPPPLSLLDLRPPSSSFSFRSYDWYQDIIGDPAATESPTTPTVPSRSPLRIPNPLAANPPNMNSSLLFAPPSPGLPSPRLPQHLHPNSAAGALSPTNPNFRLSPTVYQRPTRPSIPEPSPRPPSLLNRVADLSFESRRTSRVQSQMTQRTHNSRSWLPEEGLYLAEEGTQDVFEMYIRRPSVPESGRPDSYSPLV